MSKSPKRSKGQRLVGRVIGFSIVVIILLVVGAYVLLAKMLRDDIARLPTELERAHRLGLPLDRKEFEAFKPRTPDNQNAAPYYKKIFAELRRYQTAEFRKPSPKPTKPGVFAMTPTPVEDFDAVKNDVLAAIRYPHYDFEVDWNHSVTLPMGMHMVSMQESGYWDLFFTIQADISKKKSRKDTQGELDDLDILITFTRQAPEYLSVTGGAMLEDTKRMVLQILFDIVQGQWQDKQVLDRAEKITKRIQLPDFYKRMETNFAFGREAIKQIDSMQQLGIHGTPIAQLNKAGDELVKTLDVKQAFDAKYVKMYVDLFESLPKDRTDWKGMYRAIADANKKADNDKSPGGYINRLLKPDFEREPITFAAILASQRLLLTAIQVFRDRARLGKFPERLTDIDLSWVDPVSKTPIHYRPQADGFTLSSGPHDLSDKPLFRSEMSGMALWDSICQYTDHPKKPGTEAFAWSQRMSKQLKEW